MKVSYQWLNDYVDVTAYQASELAEMMTRSGIEVDVVEERNKGVSGVVVGHVLDCGQHPDADKLSVCQIDVGEDAPLEIVCGASNIAAGQKVPVAKIGAVLPGNFKIKKAKLRGVASQGMVCSAKELGVNEKLLPKDLQEGIWVLPDELEVGSDILEHLGLHDHVMELDLTPNRADCLSMLGVAYEMAAILDVDMKQPALELVESDRAASDHVRVTIEDSACQHYSARYIEDVKVAPSPLWLQNRLIAAGIRPINNLVDVTNYVMLEYGQPLHAFDADRMSGDIEVRTAKPGEALLTLDQKERQLEPSMLAITAGGKPVALAGVMGGAESEVHEGTVRVILESALFHGESVRLTSRDLGLRSESSLRFEKGVDPLRVTKALDRAASLIAELAGGKVAQGIVEAKTAAFEAIELSLSTTEVNNYLGTDISTNEVAVIFRRLDFSLRQDGDVFYILVPSRRGDITRKVDLIEEVARLYGYDKIPVTLASGETTPGSLTKEQYTRRIIRRYLSGVGFSETVSYSFTDSAEKEAFPGRFPEAQPVRLAHPMSEERSVLRTSLIPHLLDAAAYNLNRNINRLALFEMGSIFIHHEAELTTLPDEKLMLGMLWSGEKQEAHWSDKANKVDFYDLKGIVQSLLGHLGISDIEYRPAQPQGFHPGRTAELVIGSGESAVSIGWLGQIHPELQLAKDLTETYVLELDLEPVLARSRFEASFLELPKYPDITRDLAIVVKEDITAGELLAAIEQAGKPLLVNVRIFDVYQGEHVGEGYKSIAFSLLYRDLEKTLTDEEVSAKHDAILKALVEQFSAELRA